MNVAPEVGAVAVVVRADVKPVAVDGGWCAPRESIASDAATWSLPPAVSAAAHSAHTSGGMAARYRLMVTKTPCRMILRTHTSVKPWVASSRSLPRRGGRRALAWSAGGRLPCGRGGRLPRKVRRAPRALTRTLTLTSTVSLTLTPTAAHSSRGARRTLRGSRPPRPHGRRGRPP